MGILDLTGRLGDQSAVSKPNILYLHSHDTGRFIQPYGHQVPTPNIQRLADQGLLFRKAFCAAPTCSGSRSALLTGEYPHSNGMMGLAHRGFELFDYSHHIVHTLREAGYWSGLIGEQHLSNDTGVLGYDHVVESDTNHVDYVAPAAVELIAQAPPQPFFLSVGFFETHREYFEPTSVRDALYSLPPDNLPDTPETRRDMASYKASARSLDQGVGSVLNALDEHDLADDTLVILTTDHGLAFPGAKATLTDRGIGVLLIVRGPHGFHGGRVSDALVSQIDLFPTIWATTSSSMPTRAMPTTSGPRRWRSSGTGRASRSSCRSGSSRPTATTSSRRPCATSSTRSRRRTCPTRRSRGATWRRSSRARAHSTTASAPC